MRVAGNSACRLPNSSPTFLSTNLHLHHFVAQAIDAGGGLVQRPSHAAQRRNQPLKAADLDVHRTLLILDKVQGPLQLDNGLPRLRGLFGT